VVVFAGPATGAPSLDSTASSCLDARPLVPPQRFTQPKAPKEARLMLSMIQSTTWLSSTTAASRSAWWSATMAADSASLSQPPRKRVLWTEAFFLFFCFLPFRFFARWPRFFHSLDP